jgi:HPt (histidine-containing phosphotransfer) domain-containing protein
MSEIILDTSKLVLIANGDPHFLRGILTDFENSVPEILNELSDAIIHYNSLDTQSLAHELRGAALSVGAYALGDLAEQLQVLAEADLWKSADETFGLIRTCWEKTKIQIQEAA